MARSFRSASCLHIAGTGQIHIHLSLLFILRVFGQSPRRLFAR